MKNCIACGKEIEDTIVWCPFCKTEQTTETNLEVDASQQNTDSNEATTAVTQINNNEQQPVYQYNAPYQQSMPYQQNMPYQQSMPYQQNMLYQQNMSYQQTTPKKRGYQSNERPIKEYFEKKKPLQNMNSLIATIFFLLAYLCDSLDGATFREAGDWCYRLYDYIIDDYKYMAVVAVILPWLIIANIIIHFIGCFVSVGGFRDLSVTFLLIDAIIFYVVFELEFDDLEMGALFLVVAIIMGFVSRNTDGDTLPVKRTSGKIDPTNLK